MADAHAYAGGELELFAGATRWKAYLASQIAPFARGRVLEVGAGIGGTTSFAARLAAFERWVCLEPDPALKARMEARIASGEIPKGCEPRLGTLRSIPEGERFDSLLYIDVLEHIEDDQGELREAAAHLAPGGTLVVLVPAWQWLYSPFDRAIGHFRRYSPKALRAVAPSGLKLIRMRSLDSVGLLASLGNRLLLRQELPGRGQIAAWDRALVPLSRILDPLLAYSLGRSVLGVWKKEEGPGA